MIDIRDYGWDDFFEKEWNSFSGESIFPGDIVFLMQSLNRDFNVRRLERYLIAAWGSGAAPVVILSKADLCDNPAEKTAAVYAAAPGVEVHAVSCVTGEGIEDIKNTFQGEKQ